MDWLSPASAVGQRRRHSISSPWTLLSDLWQLPIMLVAETFPQRGRQSPTWLDHGPAYARRRDDRWGCRTHGVPASALPHHLIRSVLNAGLYVYGCLSKRSMEIRSSNRYGLTWEKEKGEETRSLEVGTVVMASGHPWRGKRGGGMQPDVVLLQRIFIALLDICLNMGVCVVLLVFTVYRYFNLQLRITISSSLLVNDTPSYLLARYLIYSLEAS
jgi:hypothetical protein